MNKIKEILTNVYVVIAAILVGAVGILLYYLNGKNKEINALHAQVDLADTQKKADLLEADINAKLDNQKLLQKEVDGLNAGLVKLEEQRKSIAGQEQNKTSGEVEDYWNKDKK